MERCTSTFQPRKTWLVAFLVLMGACAVSSGIDEKSLKPSTNNPTAAALAEDPFLWLEDVTSERSLDWVHAQNDITRRALEASPDFEKVCHRLLAILDSKDRIPYIEKHGAFYYNFWRDEKNPRGVWRRTTLSQYKKPDTEWETVLDLDKLSTGEKENWVWKGCEVLYPTYDRCLMFFSRGGAVVVREFDLRTREFVKDGFYLPEAKSQVAWRDRDSIYVGTDFGPGSLTTSGYPRIVKEWKRGTPLANAQLVFEGKPEDVSVDAMVVHDHGHTYEFIRRAPTFFTSQDFVRQADRWVKIDKPDDVQLSTFEDQLLFKPRLDWAFGGKTFPAGSLLATDFAGWLKGDRKLSMLFEPAERSSLAATSATKNYLILNALENVRSRVYVLKPAAGRWSRQPLQTPAFGSVGISGVDPDESDDYFMTLTDFLTPTSLYLGTVGETNRELLKSLPAFFNAQNLEITQHEATSTDGTKVPYFQVSRKDIELDGSNPTLLYGYGGFEVPMLPNYNAAVGAAWLEQGGVYVLANIRGGGEFGPKWHEAARKENRQRAYDDFISVAQDLINRKVTSPRHLGIQGGSNGGLLMGVMLTERPDLFHAVVCQVPLLDMKRFQHLLAGASWMDEYGNPDIPGDWTYISKYSPYQNVVKDKQYPRTLFLTSTKDDRVHPGHARKMVAKMEDQHHDVLYYENTEGGHAGAANNKQQAYMAALAYIFLRQEL